MILLEKPSLPATPLQWVAICLGLICSTYGFVVQPIAQKYTTPERIKISTRIAYEFQRKMIHSDIDNT